MKTIFKRTVLAVWRLKSFKPMVRNVLVAATLFGLVPAAYGATLYVANNGVDLDFFCGTKSHPCRSITQAIVNSQITGRTGDTITVGPGIYGDLDGSGVLGDQAGEEFPEFVSPACDCVLSIDWPVIVLSSDGAAATVIDARKVSKSTNVAILTDNAEFGRPGHGFTVTGTSAPGGGNGVTIDGSNIKVQGNLVIGPGPGTYGIEVDSNPSAIVLIAQNQVINWGIGILSFSAGTTISKNQISLNSTDGIDVHGGSVVGNVVFDSVFGIQLSGATSAIGNAVYGNIQGFIVNSPFNGVVIQKNNIFGNTVGLNNEGAPGLVATHNYWGASTGPGPAPANDVLNSAKGGATTTTTPFAKSPFVINPTFQP